MGQLIRNAVISKSRLTLDINALYEGAQNPHCRNSGAEPAARRIDSNPQPKAGFRLLHGT